MADSFDPAAHAARTPESSSTSSATVPAIGVGPGDPAYLTDRGRHELEAADVVVGFETVLDVVRDATEATFFTCGYDDQRATLERFADRVADGERGAAVLMGDPNHSGYQFLGRVERALERPVEVVPGISSLQVAASRARTPMEETTFVTLHRRGDVSDGIERLQSDVGERHLLVLPRPFDLMPEDVADRLVSGGAAPDLSALVYERLTRPDETRTKTTLGELANDASDEESAFSDLSVLVVRSA